MMKESNREKLSILLTIINYPTIGSTLRTYCEDELVLLLKDNDTSEKNYKEKPTQLGD